MFKHIESVIFFVADIHAAARWYGELLDVDVKYENADFAYLNGPNIVLGFHPADAQNPGGVGGTTSYWEVDNLDRVRARMEAAGAKLHRGPGVTDLGARVCMLIDPFGNSIGLNQANADA